MVTKNLAYVFERLPRVFVQFPVPKMIHVYVDSQ